MVASAGARNPDALSGRGADGRLGVLLARNDVQRRVTAAAVLVVFRAYKRQQRDDRKRTGEILDQVDAWIGEGVLNGEQLRSSDFAVASSLALAEYIVTLKPELQRRPLMALVNRVFSRSAGARDRA